MLKNIIWDVDGTLFDTYPAFAHAFHLALTDLGRESPLPRIEELARDSLGACIRALADEHGLAPGEIETRFVAHYAALKPQDEPPFPGAAELCDYICRIGGTNVIVTHRSRSGTERLLTANNLTNYFAGWLTADDGLPRKPDPAAFDAAIRLHGLIRGETLAMGDRDLDIQAGRAAGIFTVRFGTQRGQEHADLTIQDLSALRDFLESARDPGQDGR
jgi:phosphoglycolate phosphatase-like HAD superfamily hydrolase